MDKEGQSIKEPVSHKQHWPQNIRFMSVGAWTFNDFFFFFSWQKFYVL